MQRTILPPAPQTLTAQAIVVVAMCIAGAAMLIAAHQPSGSADAVAVDSHSGLPFLQPEATTAQPSTATPVAEVRPHAVEAVTKPRVTSVAKTTIATEPVKAATVESTIRPGIVATPAELIAPEPAPAAPAASYSAPAAPQGPPPVTVTGCLQFDDGTYELKDTTGDNAPKSRSWKSGFLKKRAASIDMLDPAKSHQLSTYVGQRVAVTGALADREMHVQSIQRIAAACN